MNERRLCHLFAIAVVCLAAALPAGALVLKCPPDSVKVGDVCIDRYESSIWQVPPGNTVLIRDIQLGRVTLADLMNAGASTTATGPGALFRGGSFSGVFVESGVFALDATNPARTARAIGFRCGRTNISTPPIAPVALGAK